MADCIQRAGTHQCAIFHHQSIVCGYIVIFDFQDGGDWICLGYI